MITIEVETGQTIHVTWFDSASRHGWVYDELQAEPKVIESIGFVAALGTDAIVLTSGRSETGGIINPLTIPICCVQSYKVL